MTLLISYQYFFISLIGLIDMLHWFSFISLLSLPEVIAGIVIMPFQLHCHHRCLLPTFLRFFADAADDWCFHWGRRYYCAMIFADARATPGIRCHHFHFAAFSHVLPVDWGHVAAVRWYRFIATPSSGFTIAASAWHYFVSAWFLARLHAECLILSTPSSPRWVVITIFRMMFWACHATASYTSPFRRYFRRDAILSLVAEGRHIALPPVTFIIFIYSSIIIVFLRFVTLISFSMPIGCRPRLSIADAACPPRHIMSTLAFHWCHIILH